MFTLPIGLFANQSGGGDPGDVLTGLIAAWNFESDFVDQVGANDLTNNGSVAIAPGIVGNAAEFDGSNSLSSASTSDLQMGAIDFTLSLIVVLGASGSEAGLVGKWSTYVDPEYLLYLDTDQPAFKIQTPGGTLFSGVVLSPSTPYLIIAKHRAIDSTLTIRVVELGGSVDQTDTGMVFGINAPAAAAFYIGRGDTNYTPAGTLIDSCHIWKRYLSTADEELLINGGLGAEYPFI